MSLTLYSAKSLMSLHHRISIRDERKREWYYARSALVSFTNETTIYNADDEKVATIRRKIIAIRRSYVIKMNNGLSITMSRELLHAYKDVLDLPELGWKCEGNIFQLHFAIYDRHHRKLAAIEQKMVSLHDKYRIEVYDPTHLDIIITILITLEHMIIDEEASKNDR